jgi:hypothetical protein
LASLLAVQATALYDQLGGLRTHGGVAGVHFTRLGSSYAVAEALPAWLVISDKARYHTITCRV